ncbi:hypothetical protein QUA56_17020 [Microcoleus sp. N3A4]|uniref:hypothetical protein n=1 Tax=Microcoleus sp. N3A4 TaxID=3055379 RepID=UPI002FD1EFE7
MPFPSRDFSGNGNAVSRIQNNRSLRGGTPSRSRATEETALPFPYLKIILSGNGTAVSRFRVILIPMLTDLL